MSSRHLNFSLFSLLLTIVLLIPGLSAAEEIIKPYMLSSESPGSVAEKADQAKVALAENGFTIVGSYSPYAGAVVIAVTNDELKKTAAESEFGGYGAVARVAVTKGENGVQVSYFNPVWMANAYRLSNDLTGVAAGLKKALGAKEAFGSEDGEDKEDLRDFHFMIMMPYFDDHNTLAEYDSYEEAVKAVEAGLAAKKGGTSKVYRVDVPGKEETLFGVAMTEDASGDKHIMDIIDFGQLKQTANLPYEILVSGGNVYALHAKFRIAVNFPDLTMGTFTNIMDAPGAIEDALAAAAGAEDY